MRKKASCYILLLLLVFPLISSLITTEASTSGVPTSESFVPAQTDDFKRGPVVGMVTNNSAVIFWRTAGLTDATVDYGLNDSLLETESNSTLDTDHYIALSNLEIGSKYWYQVTSSGDSSEVYFFKTAPADGEEFKLVIAGDNRPQQHFTPAMPEIYPVLIDLIIAEEPDLVVLTGDFVYRVTEDHEDNLEAWEGFTNITDRLAHYAPIYGALGNHDTGGGTGSSILEYFFDAFVQFDEPSSYFSFDYAGAHFTILNTQEDDKNYRITGTQYDWLVDDLTNSDSAMKFVFGHAPLYPVIDVNGALAINETERDRLQQLFEDTNVTLYANAHEHTYNRMRANGVIYITSGGMGAILYNGPWGDGYYNYVPVYARANYLNLSSIDSEGQVRDFYELPNDEPIQMYHREYANGSSRSNGTMPEIYFSEIPVEKYFSWDNGPNTTAPTGFPDPPGEHRLDVYALDDSDRWSHMLLVYTTVNDDWTTPTTPSNGSPVPINLLLIFGLIGVVGVVIVVIAVVKLRR
ncbi:MAG: metallophosphoesterase [Candidatus Thorarchaeota archaeon]